MPSEAQGLLVSDADSTLILNEVIDLLAARAGREAAVASMTREAMVGSLDFEASLRRRVAMLAGVPVMALRSVADEITIRPGAHELMAAARSRGWRTLVVSGGFSIPLERVARELRIDRVVANALESDGYRLTGVLRGTVIDAEGKARAVREAQRHWGVGPERTIVMGDGANDCLMMREAATRIGVEPKPALRKDITHEVSESLRGVIKILAVVDAGD